MKTLFLALFHGVAFSLTAVNAQEPAPAATGPSPAAAEIPHFQEVLRLIRGNLEGVTEQELNAAMVDGLLQTFHPRVLLLSADPTPEPTAEDDALGRVKTYQAAFGYLRVRTVSSDLPGLLAAAVEELRASPQLQGFILDLRATGGQDYQAAAAAADLFVPAGKPLVQWDDQALSSSDPGQPEPELPMVLLVNSETTGAAEALAGALHESGPAVLIGSRTAGAAFAMRSFRLEDGQELRIAGAPVQVGRDRSLAAGLVPDLEIASQPDQERAWIDDPFHVPVETRVAGAANRPRYDEADLIREHNGDNDPQDNPPRPAPSDEPVLQDPALVRALAVLTGLARVRGGIRR